MILEEYEALQIGDILELDDYWFESESMPIPSIRWEAEVIEVDYTPDSRRITLRSLNAIKYNDKWNFVCDDVFEEPWHMHWRKKDLRRLQPPEHRINLLEP